ncbi:MAG: hypothetical protein ACOCZQ_01470 [Nanoarchaeota archaeon]
MRGLKLRIMFVMLMAITLSGCSVFMAEQPGSDQVCVPKSDLDELGITIDEFMKELAAKGVVNETIVNETITDDCEELYYFDDTMDECDYEEFCGVYMYEGLRTFETEEECKEALEEVLEERKDEDEDELPVREFAAGELVEITPQTDAQDLTFEFSNPLDEEGKWQTTEDDVGEYIINVTATNKAEDSFTRQIKLVITEPAQPPIIEMDNITVEAGENVVLEPQVTHPEGKDVNVSFSGWMDSAESETTEDDIGEHIVVITADDGIKSVEKEITVTVERPALPPELQEISNIEVTEGDLVEVEVNATHPYDEEIDIVFSEPLDEEGKWQTEEGDAETYNITVTAVSDGLSVEENFTLTVNPEYEPPVLEHPDVKEFNVTEGETKTIELQPEVSHPQDMEVNVTYSGWMTEATKEITSDDEGEHMVTIEATDGIETVEKEVTVIVEVVSDPEDWTI